MPSTLGQRIASEVAKMQQPTPPGSGKGGAGIPPPQPTRKVRVIRITEVATVTKVSSEQEWEQLSSKLDQQVRKLLTDGFDVELG